MGTPVLASWAQLVQARVDVELRAGHVAQARTLETALQGVQVARMQSRASEERARDVTVPVALLGELALVAVPGELFNRLGQAIKQTSERFVVLLGYTNGYEGYLPSREAYRELDYEVLVSPVCPGIWGAADAVCRAATRGWLKYFERCTKQLQEA